MQIALGAVLILGVCGGVFQKFAFAGPLSVRHVISKDVLDAVAGGFHKYDSYVKLSNRKLDNSHRMAAISQLHRFYVGHPERAVTTEKPQRVKQTEYLLIKAIRQRDKRYVNYLTLCHFKICNMGRKRTSRYVRTTNGNKYSNNFQLRD